MWRRRTCTDDDFSEEIRAHVALDMDRFIAEGMSPADARAAALRAFGNVTRAHEQFYEGHRLVWLDDLRRDVRFACRALRRSPGFALVLIATLALGIGANTAVFSVVNAALLKPLPYPQSDQIVSLMSTWRGQVVAPGASEPKFTAWRQSATAFQDVAAYTFAAMNLTGHSQPEPVMAGLVSAEFFHVFGTRAAQGRTFTADEDRPRGPHVVVLSDRFWRDRLGMADHGVGQTVTLDGDPYEVVGILEPGFDADALSFARTAQPDIWLPLQLEPHSEDEAPYYAAARLRAGSTLGAAQAQTQAAAAAFGDRFPAAMPPGYGLTVEPLQTVVVGDVRPTLLVLVAAVAVVLLMVCATAATLLLARASARQREIAIRCAIGATRGRVVRQLLTESAVLTVLGGALGFMLAVGGIRALLAMKAGTIPRIVTSAAPLDWPVLLFIVMVSVTTCLAFGLFPALQAPCIAVDRTLREANDRVGSGMPHHRSRGMLVILQTALAMMLLVGSGLLIRSFVALRHVNPGFDTHDILTMRTPMAGRRFATTAPTAQLASAGIHALDAVPGVDRAAVTMTGIPLETGSFLSINIVGRRGDSQLYAAGWYLISPGYFDVLRIPLVRGRVFTDRDDRSGSPVVIINQAMAQRFWPQSDPLKDRIQIGQDPPAGQLADLTPRQIVGVVGDARHQGLDREIWPSAYVPLAQVPDGQTAFFNRSGGALTWLVRTRETPYLFEDTIQRTLRDATEDVPLARVRSMDEISTASTARYAFAMWLMTFFAGSALLLASVGLYGVMAYAVTQRTREIGIRVALGARPSAVRALVLGQSAVLTAIGIALGLAGATGVTRYLRGMLFGLTPLDATTFIAVSIVFAAVATLAAYIPARRATKVDPLVSLRCE